MATDKQIKFLKRVYFGVSNNPKDDVNPFNDNELEDFGRAKVGDLRWGISSEAKQRSKIRFAYNYHKVLSLYGVALGVDDIYMSLTNQDSINNVIIESWANNAVFNN
jgi:hypothetical protein